MNFQPLKDFLDGYLAMLGITGSDTVIYRNHQEIFRYQSGYDDINLATPIKPNAFYNIYSCTKVATAVAVTQLIERGEIVVSDPLYAYFPEYRNVTVKVKDEAGNTVDLKKPDRPILIKDLLTMTSGINYNTDSSSIRSVIQSTGGKAPTLEVISAIADEPLECNPGERFVYGLSSDVLGGVVELVSGMRLRDYMRENIFAPLMMNETCFHPTAEMSPRFATQYSYDSKTRTANRIDFNSVKFRLGTEYDSGGAGIISTVDDYILLADALAAGGVGKSGERILSKYGVRLMGTNMLTSRQALGFDGPQNDGYGYGYGVRVNMYPEEVGSIAPVGEFGWDGAKLSYISSHMESGISVFHAEHMGGFHAIVLPRLRNLIYSCIGE